MKRLGGMSGAGALMLLALSCAAPAGAAVPSAGTETRAPAMAGEAPAAGESDTEANARRIAVNACVQANEFGPARLVQAVGDGFGDWLVWVEDRDGDLWTCNADRQGHVFLNVVLAGDLLEGRGSEFLRTEPALTVAKEPAHVENASRDLCVAVAGLTQPVTVLTTVPDGMGDNLVWMRLADGQLWMCDASADGKLFVFEPVGGPALGADDAGTLAAEAPGF